MENDIILATQTSSLSTNVFSDREAFQNLFGMAKMFASSALVPINYQGKPMDCAIAIDMANRMGVSPMMVMQNLYVVKGKPQWSGQACMTLIQGSRKFRDVHHVYFGEKNTDEWGCYVEAERINNGETVQGAAVTIAMAKAEGWYSKKDKYGNETSKWQTIPELMLAYRASAFFARVHIPESLMGVYVEGEVEDIKKQERPTTDDPLGLSQKIMEEAEEVFA